MKHKYFVLVLSLATVLLLPAFVYAQSPSSTNYQIQEDFVGPGGDINSSSPNYSSIGSIGDIAIGESAPPTGGPEQFRTISGYNTTNDPALTFVVNTSSLNFGSLSTSTATTANSTFSVYNYLSSGYVVYSVGTPPSTGGHTLNAMSSTAASSVGTEQFGINLVANTSPSAFGANPVQVPSSNFSYGSAATNYNTANLYRYVNGESIATATKSSGQTNFTISYIVNVAITTPGGMYSGVQELVCVGTY